MPSISATLLEPHDGRLAGIEVKPTAIPSARDAKGFAHLRDKLGRRFVAGLVLHTGIAATPFGDRIAAVPIDILWTT